MHFRKFSGYALYPLLAFLLLLPSASRAQDSQPTSAASQATPADQSSQSQVSATPQSQAEILRQAQARVNARRRIRIRQIIQQTYNHKYELNSGGGALRFIPGGYLQRINEAGWMIDLTDYFHGDLGVDADFRGYYGTAYTGTNPYSVFNPSISQYTFMAGPRYRFFKGQHWGWTAEGLAGAGHGNFGTGTHGLPPTLVGLYNDSTVLNFLGGVSADWNLTPAVAFRFTANELFTNYGSSFQENLGGNVGIVYRFGKR
ncbi:MAG TPA: hypothetical protein VL990_00505 [Acidobacteriaceae bacterium]|nr:hypothetical protein [Acidobacteriaceae bacterium]